MKLWKTFSGIVLSAFLCSAMPVSAADQYQKMRDEVVMLVNEQRAAYGAAEVYESALLNQAAQKRAEELAVQFSHKRPDGRSSYSAFTDIGGEYLSIAENIGGGFTDEASAVNTWMGSAGHRENILDTAYIAVGVGIYDAGGTTYWVQMFSDGIGLSSIYTTGNINFDSSADALDAAEVLVHAAQTGAGNDGTLSRLQRSYTDVNQDGRTDSTDAAIILSYAAYAGAGGSDSIEVFAAGKK